MLAALTLAVLLAVEAASAAALAAAEATASVPELALLVALLVASLLLVSAEAVSACAINWGALVNTNDAMAVNTQVRPTLNIL